MKTTTLVKKFVTIKAATVLVKTSTAHNNIATAKFEKATQLLDSDKRDVAGSIKLARTAGTHAHMASDLRYYADKLIATTK